MIGADPSRNPGSDFRLGHDTPLLFYVTNLAPDRVPGPTNCLCLSATTVRSRVGQIGMATEIKTTGSPLSPAQGYEPSPIHSAAPGSGTRRPRSVLGPQRSPK